MNSKKFSKISDSTVKVIQCSQQLTPNDLAKTTFEVLKITKCPSVGAIFNFITSLPFRDHFIQARCAFVVVAECNRDVIVRKLYEDELQKLSLCYKDKKLMIVSIEGGRDDIEVDSKDIRNLGGDKLQKKFSFDDMEELYGANWREEVAKAMTGAGGVLVRTPRGVDGDGSGLGVERPVRRVKVSTQIYYKQLNEHDFITITNGQVLKAINVRRSANCSRDGSKSREDVVKTAVSDAKTAERNLKETFSNKSVKTTENEFLSSECRVKAAEDNTKALKCDVKTSESSLSENEEKSENSVKTAEKSQDKDEENEKTADTNVKTDEENDCSDVKVTEPINACNAFVFKITDSSEKTTECNVTAPESKNKGGITLKVEDCDGETTGGHRSRAFSQNFSFSSLLLNLTVHGYGTFNGRLLETRIDTCSCFNRKRLIDYAIESNKILSIRFLQLFNFDLQLANENDDRPLEIAARLPTMDAFLALLKFKFEFWNDELSRCDYNLLHLRNRRGFTLLMLAAASGNAGVVNLLAKFGVDKNYEAHGETAASLAWKNQKFEAFLTLLKFDARYPRNFKCELEERWESVPKELKKFVTTLEAFHLSVSKNDAAEFEPTLQNFPNIFHFYNTRNESAALVALKNRSCNSWTYEELVRLGVFIGFDEKFEDLLRNAGDENAKSLCGRRLITLMSKSHVGYCTSYEEKKRKIQHLLRTFGALYGIEQIRPILKIVVERPIKIIFDFNRQSVQHLHPEAHNYSSAHTFSFKGYIYIGAKGLLSAKEECDVLATLAHKLLHYVLEIIYENESRPYYADDVDRALEFAEINEFCRQQPSHAEDVMRSVYEFDEGEQHAELIARVAHVLALYSNHAGEEKRRACTEKYKKLFAFYERRTVSDLKPQNLIEMKLKNEIYKLNTGLGTVTQLRASAYRLKTESLKINVCIKDKSIIVLSNCPLLTATAVFQRHKVESCHVGSAASLASHKSDSLTHQLRLFLYATHDRLEDTQVLSRIKELLKVFDTFDSHLSLTLIVNCESRSIKAMKNIAKKFQPFRVAFIVDASANTVNREVLAKSFELRDVKHTWNDLTSASQAILAEFTVNFQGCEMRLRDFLPDTSPVWKELPINTLLAEQALTIADPIENDTKYYVRRMFIDSTARSNRWDEERNEFVDEYDKPVRSFDEITGTEATRVILLADEPKAGKTATFKSVATRLKAKFPSKWVVFIDHKHHADVYRTCKSIEWNQPKLALFISQEILQLREYEQRVFEEFFVTGRVVVLLEMNVFYQEILDFAVRIRQLSANQLWISSWPQHASKLEAAFATTAFKLVAFNDDNRREFFVKFLNSKGVLAESDVRQSLHDIEEFLQQRVKDDAFPCDIPLMLRMVAEAYETSMAAADHPLTFKRNSLFSLYQAFVGRTLGPLASNSRLNIMQLHQKYALKEVFCRKRKKECEDVVKSLAILAPRVAGTTHKKIFTCGIMYKLEHAKLKFIHKTFADFFVALFLIDCVLNGELGDSTETEMRALLFLSVLRDSGRCHKTIHRFLDNFVEANEAEIEERFDDSCYARLSAFKPASYFRCLLWRLARHRCFHLIKFLTELYGDDERVLREMWGVVSVDGHSFLFKTIDKEDGEIDLKFTERVWTLAKEVFRDRNDLIAILRTTLVRSSCSVFKNVFPELWRFADEFLASDEKRDILTGDVLQLFAKNRTKRFFCDVCAIAEANLSGDDMKTFLTSCDAEGKNFLYHFSKSIDDEALLEYLEKVRTYLSTEEQKAMLTKRLRAMLEEDKKTPPKSFHTLWSFAEQQLEKEELKSLLLATNSSGFTIFHETVIEGDEKTFTFMVEVHERILSKEELKELIMRTFQSSKTLLFKSMGVSIESILMVWDYLQDLLDDDEATLKRFLEHRDDFGDTAFSSMKWYDAFPNDLFMPFIRENFGKAEAERLFEKVSKSSVENSVVDEKSEHGGSIAEGREVKGEGRKHKFLSLNCFCCTEAV